ncbi:MAG: hypothetical protein AAFZ92_02545 [Pseudomonadota bacterium]
MNPTQTHDDDNMPQDIDFSGGKRGKFYRPETQLQLPIHLEASVQNTLAELANAKGVDLSEFVNELLKKNIDEYRLA